MNCLIVYTLTLWRERSEGTILSSDWDILRQNKAKQKLTIVGNGSQRRDFVYVGDVAEANNELLQQISPKYFGEVFNVEIKIYLFKKLQI